MEVGKGEDLANSAIICCLSHQGNIYTAHLHICHGYWGFLPALCGHSHHGGQPVGKVTKYE